MAPPSRAQVLDNAILLPLVGVVALALAYWALIADRELPRAVSNFVVMPAMVEPGGWVTTSFDVMPLRGGRWTVVTRHELIDSIDVGYVHRLDERGIEYDPSASKSTMERPRQIPFTMPYGKTRYRITGCYQGHGITLTRLLGRLWPLCDQWEATFEIVP